MEHKLTVTNRKKISVSDSIIVQGTVASGANSFAINLGQDESNYLVQFSPHFCEQMVAYKYKKGGVWGPEQRDHQFCFQQGADATISFNCSGNAVTVNYPGGKQYSFKSQIQLDRIEYISVDGDFEVKSLSIN